MTHSAANLVAIILGVRVFLVIVAVGWQSVQHRRILRLQGADGRETIIVAGEDDEVSSVVTTTTEAPQPAASPIHDVTADVADPAPAPKAGPGAAKSGTTGGA